MNLICGIYKITNLINGKIYIGRSVNMKARKATHFSNSQHNKHLKRAMCRYGFSQFVFEVIEFCNKSNIVEREQFYLDTLLFAQEYIRSSGKDKRFKKFGYNQNPIAESSRCRPMSKSHKDKIVKKTKERLSTIEGRERALIRIENMAKLKRGQRMSDDFKEKLSIAMSGKNNPRYGINGINHPWYGKHHSIETKQKIKESKEKIIFQMDLNGHFIKEYDSLTQASRQLGVRPGNISLACTNPNRSAYGYKWRYMVPMYSNLGQLLGVEL